VVFLSSLCYCELEKLILAKQNFDPEVKEKASIYVPAVGKVTVAILLRNLTVSHYKSCCPEYFTNSFSNN